MDPPSVRPRKIVVTQDDSDDEEIPKNGSPQLDFGPDTINEFNSAKTTDKQKEEINQRKALERKQLEASFFVVLEKFGQSLQYEWIPAWDSEEEKTLEYRRHEEHKKNILCAEIVHFHTQIFHAAGYYPWLARNKPHDGEKEIGIFKGPPGDEKREERANAYIKDLILREMLWTAAEHIRHCPQRMNALFHWLRNHPENSEWYKKKEKNDIFELFLHNKHLEIIEASRNSFSGAVRQFKRYIPFLGLSKVKLGIDQFIKAEVNFDDIDDCGKYDIPSMDGALNPVMKKTYQEIPGPFLYFLLMKYSSSWIQFKLWCATFLFFWYKWGTPWPVDEFFGVNESEYPALPLFIMADFGLMTLFLINEWVLRFCLTRHRRWKSMDHFLRLKIACSLLQPIIAGGAFPVLYFVGGYSTIEANPKTGELAGHWQALAKLAIYYIPGRVLLSVIPEFFPFSPIADTRIYKPTFKQAFKKGLWKRYFARAFFFIIVFAAAALYEWWLVFPTVDILFKQPFCGDAAFRTNFALHNGINSQQIICAASTFFLWFGSILAILVDPGLSFIMVMAIVGYIRGYKTQGTARGVVQIETADLTTKIVDRFFSLAVIDPHYEPTVEIDPSTPEEKEQQDKAKAAHEAAEKEVNDEKARSVWTWCVDEWRKMDLLSNVEANALLIPEKGKPSKLINTSLLGSPDGDKHISFFINSLTTEPFTSYHIFDLPPTSIIVPCYSEKLEFDWKPDRGYSPKDEFSHLVAKFPEEWLNFLERMEKWPGIQQQWNGKDLVKEILPGLEKIIINNPNAIQPELLQQVTLWAATKDQYVFKTILGSVSYFDAVVTLAMIQGNLTRENAVAFAINKVQVILAMQIFIDRYQQTAEVLFRWLEQWPCFQVVFDYDAKKLEGKAKPPLLDPALDERLRDIRWATILMCYDYPSRKVVLRHIIPRQYPLRLENKDKAMIQGKSMNQIYALTFAFGRFIQVFDSNQGAHGPEYLKMPALLKDFKLEDDGNIRYRIIGSREYIFTKNMGTIARCHAYQEWSFGTLVLRTYSDLGIRLHYGHPDVFHGPWAVAHAGLSKVNPDINTSEDVFAGFGTMQSNESTKHVEHIQFQKARETGLGQMTGFDTKISEGNAGLLRSRDMYQLMERLDFITQFLFFQGISGHFVTISLMVASMKIYIMTLFMMSLTGSSLRAFGNTTYATEWLFHLGLTTIVPLIVEFLVEYGPVIGLLRALFFIPVSTLIYLFQMQTKHSAFIRGIMTGKSAHINTGRGLAIYRNQLKDLFKNYGFTHFYPMLYVLSGCVGYYLMSSDLGGGTLPLIMILVLVLAVLLTPQIVNPAIKGNSLSDAGRDIMKFLAWIGKPEIAQYNHNAKGAENIWPTPVQLKAEGTFHGLCLFMDFEALPSNLARAISSVFVHFFFFLVWTAVATFFLYPNMQFWFIYFLGFWFINVILYTLIYFILPHYEQPLRTFLIFVVEFCVVLYFMIWYGFYGVFNPASIYIAVLVLVKWLESIKALLCDFLVIAAWKRFPDPELPADAEVTEAHTKEINIQRESREKYITFTVSIFHKIFLIGVGRAFMAFIWGIANFIVAVLMRPLIANLFLFGANSTRWETTLFSYLEEMRKTRKKKSAFGVMK